MKAQGQIEIDLSAAPDPAAVASIKDVENVVAVLVVGLEPLPPGSDCSERERKRREGGWMTAAEICPALGLEVTENNKRKVRAIARAAWPGILSAVGMDGFKLLRKCTIEEAWSVEKAVGNLERDAVIKRKLLLDAIHSGKVGTP